MTQPPLPSPQPEGKRRTTLRDIAERTGLSINTVSAVLNPRSQPIYISAATRLRVEAAAQELNYYRNVAASRLAGGRSRLLGILTNDPDLPSEALMVCAFEGAAGKRHYQCLMCCGGSSGARRVGALRYFGEHNVEGIMVLGGLSPAEFYPKLESHLSQGHPAVLIDGEMAGDHVGIQADLRQGGRMLARHLYELGHRTFLFLSSERDINLPSSRQLIDGAQSVLEEHGLRPPFEGMTVTASQTDTWVQPLVGRLRAGTAPSAVICTGDLLALRLIGALRQAGLEVPGTIAVTGAGHMAGHWGGEWPWGAGLTTLRIPYADIGAAAANALIDRIERVAPGGPAKQFGVEIVIGGSSALPAGK